MNHSFHSILLTAFLILAGASCHKNSAQEQSNKAPIGWTFRKGALVDTSSCSMCIQKEVAIGQQIEAANKAEVVRVSPDSYPSWEACLEAHKMTRIFLLRPGDYRSWGTLKLIEKNDLLFSLEDYPAVTGQTPEHHPVNFPVGGQAILENFTFFKSSGITLNGLIFSGNNLDETTGWRFGWQNRISNGGNNLVNKCAIRNIKRGNAIRIHNSDDNIIQNTFFEQDHPELTGDKVAILIIAKEGAQARGNQILNNEIRNWNDGFMLGWNQSKKNKGKEGANQFTGECPATTFAYNHVYLTSDLYSESGEEAYAENAVDLKSGTTSNAPADKILLTKNKIWGFRRTIEGWSSGSAGEAISVHVAASNIHITENIIFDVPVGITLFSNPKKYGGASAENIVISNNIFSEIKDYGNFHNSGSGVILNTRKVSIEDNVFNEVDRSIEISKQKDSVAISRNLISKQKAGKGYTVFEIGILKWLNDPALKQAKTLKINRTDATSGF